MIGAMSPGPSLAVIIRNTMSGGRLQGVMASIGHGIGVGLYALAAVTGLALLIMAEPAISAFANWAGAGFLAWIGIRLWHASFRPGRQEVDTHSSRGARGFAEGFGIAFLNPKIAAFFLALFSQFIRPEAIWTEKGIMALTAGIIDAGWYVLVALALANNKAVAWLRQRSVLLDRVMGTVLLTIAAGLILRNH